MNGVSAGSPGRAAAAVTKLSGRTSNCVPQSALSSGKEATAQIWQCSPASWTGPSMCRSQAPAVTAANARHSRFLNPLNFIFDILAFFEFSRRRQLSPYSRERYSPGGTCGQAVAAGHALAAVHSDPVNADLLRHPARQPERAEDVAPGPVNEQAGRGQQKTR